MEPSQESRKTLIAGFLDAIRRKGKTPELIARFVADPCLQDHIKDIEAAFPAYEVISEQMVAENDLVVVPGTFVGVHQGPFAGIAPTGKAISAGLMIMYRFADNRMAQYWLQLDLHGLLRQLQS